MPTEGASRSSPRSIVLYPDPVLLTRARPVERIDDWVRDLVRDMIRVMREEDGAGIAAPQVGESVRIFVVEARPEEEAFEGSGAVRPAEPLTVHINPVLSNFEGPVEPMEEGCLSLPGIRADIRRSPIVTIDSLDLEGKPVQRRDAAMLARIWQHEFDHLEGKIILDRMSPIDRLATRKRVKELRSAFGE